MAIVNYQNLEKVKYFELEEYVKNIKLEQYLLEHLQETSNQFDKYLKYLLQYDYAAIYYLIDSFNTEIHASEEIENIYRKNNLMFDESVFFETLNISHNRIHKIHDFVMSGEKSNSEKQLQQYRKVPVRVSKMTPEGKEFIYWHGVEPEDVKPFMDKFIKVYKQNEMSLVTSHPIIKSALIHLLFVRIHPYKDGNGRTSRMLQNIKFTDLVNRIYGMKLKICPLNISGSININKPTYAKRIDSIYFDLEHDTNEAINKWFDFILNMYDEQLYYNTNRINEMADGLMNITEMKDTDHKGFIEEIGKMKIKKFN